MEKNTEIQKTICRQSNMKWILDYCKHIGVNLRLSEMIRITEALTFYTIDGRNKDVARMMEEIDKLIQSKFDETE